jgi:hypothetical protein
LFSSFLFGKGERLWSEFGVNLVHAYHPAKLVQVITMAWQKKNRMLYGQVINQHEYCLYQYYFESIKLSICIY